MPMLSVIELILPLFVPLVRQVYVRLTDEPTAA
jgi:hypothetical protein